MSGDKDLDFIKMVTEYLPPTEEELDQIMEDKSLDWLHGFYYGYIVGSQDRYQEYLKAKESERSKLRVARWIHRDNGCGDCGDYCSFCNAIAWYHSPFCQHCGSFMENGDGKD